MSTEPPAPHPGYIPPLTPRLWRGICWPDVVSEIEEYNCERDAEQNADLEAA